MIQGNNAEKEHHQPVIALHMPLFQWGERHRATLKH